MRPIPGERGLAQVMLVAQNGWNKTFGHLPRWHNVCCCQELGFFSRRDGVPQSPLRSTSGTSGASQWRGPKTKARTRDENNKKQAEEPRYRMYQENLSPLAHAHSHDQPRSVVVVVVVAAAARHPIRPDARPSGAVEDGDRGEPGASDERLAALGDPSTNRSQGGAREAKEKEGIETGRGEAFGTRGQPAATSRYA